MQELNRQMMTLPELRELEEIIRFGTGPAAVSGVSGVHRAMLGAALRQETKRPLAVLCADEQEARRMAADLAALTGEECVTLFAREWQLRDRVSASHSFEQERLDALCRMAFGRTGIVVATVDGMMQRTLPPTALRDAVLTLRLGEEHDLRALAERLTAAGYVRCEQVEGAGQFAVRGGILDVYSPMSAPVRVEFFDTEIDAMGEFDVATQRRTKNLEELTVLPAAEVLPFAAEGGRDAMLARMEHAAAQLAKKETTEKTAAAIRADMDRLREGLPLGGMDRYLAAAYPTAVCAADYLPEGSIVLVCEGSRVMERAKGCAFEWGEDLKILLEEGVLAGQFASLAVELEDLTRRLRGSFPLLLCDSLPTSRYLAPPRAMLSINARQLPSYGGNLDAAASDLAFYQKNDYASLVLCGNCRRGEILAQQLREKHLSAFLAFPLAKLPAPGQILLTDGALPFGMEYPDLRFAILTEGQLLAQTAQKPRKKHQKATNRQKLSSFTDLSPGDLIVHEYHGIGRYVGMEQIRVDGIVKDYVKIAYQGTDTLYVPATQLDLISKYIGGGEDTVVRLNKLSGDQWQKTKARAKSAAKDLAAGLIQLYAERKRRMGYAFAADTPWQAEFEDNFPYAETDDQLRCIEEIKHDMEQPAPMDRLLCGDVGFGKTEVALRAVFKCVLDGKQCAVLVPTTILAWQHYQTFLRRLEGYPVTVELLSRFRTPKQQKAILQKLADGKIDVVVGTHRLVQEDVRFRDLGLCVIDEEQRFGVKQKEKFKQLKGSVDILTLSATPIPRTLNMAMSGIRDMSVINEAPQDRHPVQTYVLEYDDGILLEAIRKELRRGGQVFYLHNRIDNIELTAAHLREELPEARIVTAHGKMSEEELSEIWQRLLEREIDILVCTTIIEAGVDVPNCNTLIIEDADRMGLSQLYQLRGRVGRSGRRAYAYFTFRRGKALSEISEKRLEAIREFTSFGSGFRIAMRDLEIRGAGNILGSAQHGQMEAVGYDLYLRLLGDAIREQKGEKPVENLECLVDIQIEAHIPEKYIPSLAQRIDIYKKIAAIRTEDDWSDTMDELCDRFGEPPRSVAGLLDVALIRSRAAALGIREIDQRVGSLLFYSDRIDRGDLLALTKALPGRVLMNAGAKPYLTVKLQKGQEPMAGIREVLTVLEAGRPAAAEGCPQ